MEIADDLSAQEPQVVDVLLKWSWATGPMMPVLKEVPETDHQCFGRWQILFPSHPRAWPAGQVTTVTLQAGRRAGGGAVYRRGFRRCLLLRHGTDYDSKPLPPFSGLCLLARPLQCGQKKHRSRRAASLGFGRSLFALPSAGPRLRPTRGAALRVHPLWGFFVFLL